MFSVQVTDQADIVVQGRKHQFFYASDGSKPNPLEAAYATLVGCAAVYTKKACKKLNKSAEGIKISGRVVAKPEQPSKVQKWMTDVLFPSGWNPDEKALVLEEIQHCAVKELLRQGHEISFVVTEVFES